jgi:hypothetical protein
MKFGLQRGNIINSTGVSDLSFDSPADRAGQFLGSRRGSVLASIEGRDHDARQAAAERLIKLNPGKVGQLQPISLAIPRLRGLW